MTNEEYKIKLYRDRHRFHKIHYTYGYHLPTTSCGRIHDGNLLLSSESECITCKHCLRIIAEYRRRHLIYILRLEAANE